VFCEFASCHKIVTVTSPKIVLKDCPKIVCEFGPWSVGSQHARDLVIMTKSQS